MIIYEQTETSLGLECDCNKKHPEIEHDPSWIRFEREKDGSLFIDKFYGCCEPSLTPENVIMLSRLMSGHMMVRIDTIPALRKLGRRLKTRPLNKRGTADI
jgi:hypothetical protein